MNKHPLVCDTTLLLYLGRIDEIQLLSALFEPICMPEAVRLELDMGRLLRPDTIDPAQYSWIQSVTVSRSELEALPPNRLGRGEQAVIAYALSHRGHWVGLDDQPARLLAESLGLKVVGCVGVLVRAKKAGLIPVVQPLLTALRLAGFHLAPELYREALRLAGETLEEGRN